MKENLHNMFYGASPMIHLQAKNLRKRETSTEKLLWSYLSNNQLGVKFRRQHPINQFIVDFYCHQLKLVVEVDGKIHSTRENAAYDKMRTELLNHFNIQVIRYSNEEVTKRPKGVIDSIEQVIAILKK